MPRPVCLLALSFLCAALLGCGGRSSRLGGSPQTGALQRIDTGRAVLTLLPDSFVAGGTAEGVSVKEREASGEILLDVSVRNAHGLKALFLQLDYDSVHYSAGEVDSRWLIAPQEQCLAMRLDDGAGRAEYGEMLVRPQQDGPAGNNPGFSGDGLLCTIHLKPGTAKQQRRPSKAPLGDGASAMLNVDSIDGTLSWTYRSPGDYNQNGEIAVTDLTPIGIHFNEDVPVGDDNSIQSVIDGNADGKVAVADLTAIGLNFGARSASYNVYASLSADDFPAENNAANGPGSELIGSLPFSAASGTSTAERLAFSFLPENVRLGWFYWIRPNDSADGSGADGTPSSLASFGGQAGNLDPIAAFTADPLSGSVPLAVSLDASTSSDPDGASGSIADIVQFAWDFDGDGQIDKTTADPLFDFEYQSAGVFKCVLVVTDSQAAVGSAQVIIDASGGGNAPPTAVVEAEPLSGGLPLLVQFDASASSDDGGIENLSFNWDFDGDGFFDLSTGDSPLAVHNFVTPGQFNVKVEATDQLGLSASAEIGIDVAVQPGDPPTAVISEPPFGETDFNGTNTAPHTFFFGLDESTDVAPGQIVFYQFDFEGDGIFDFEGPSPFHGEQPNVRLSKALGPGQYTATLVVTDDSGNTDTATLDYKYTVNNNLPPVCVFNIERTTFNIGEIVDVFCSESSDDQDNFLDFDIDKFGTDNFVFIGSTEGDSQLQYLTAGVFRCTVRVTDNEGLSDFESHTLTVLNPGNQPPVPVIGIGASSGSAPFVTSLDDTGSTDPDGVIALYEWDTTGDGLPEFVSETPAVFNATFRNKGVTTVTLRVTDNEGASASATTQVTLDSGWTFNTVASGVNLNTNTSAAFISRTLAGDITTSTPAVSFATFDTHQLAYAQADPETPENWGVPVQVVPPGLVDGFVSLAEVQDRPALAFQYFDGLAGGPAFVRASSDSGLSWGAPQLLVEDGRNGGFSPDLRVINGTPAILYSRIFPADNFPEQRYILAGDPLGNSFLPSVRVTGIGIGDPSEHIINSQLLQVAGRPMAFSSRSAIALSREAQGRRANDSQGSAWGIGQPFFSSSSVLVFSLSAELVDGNPAVASTGDSFELGYIRAQDTLGDFSGASEISVFQDPTGDSLHSCDMAVAAGRPVIAFESAASGDLLLSVAADTAGNSWNEPLVLDQLGRVGGFASIASSGSDLLISYYDQSNRRIRAAYFREFVAE